jgi:hypothetical protein
MKQFLTLALLFVVTSTAFATGPQTAGSSHAENGHDYKDTAIAIAVSQAEEGLCG